MESLTWFERAEFYWALEDLCRDPHPDNRFKVPLDGFPYATGALGFSRREFWIVYSFLNDATLYIASVCWRPDSPRRSGELLEG